MIDLMDGENVNPATDIRKQIHAALMILSFAIFIPGGAVVAIFFKKSNPDGSAMRLHKTLQSTGIICGIMGVVTAFLYVPAGNHLTKPHHILGITTITLALLQPLNAFFRPHASEGQVTWKWLHRLGGSGTLICGIVNIFLGIAIYPTVENVNKRSLQINISYLIVTVIFVTSILVFVVLYWVCPKDNGGKQSRGFAFSQKVSTSKCLRRTKIQARRKQQNRIRRSLRVTPLRSHLRMFHLQLNPLDPIRKERRSFKT